jgi:hypothetical protein
VVCEPLYGACSCPCVCDLQYGATPPVPAAFHASTGWGAGNVTGWDNGGLTICGPPACVWREGPPPAQSFGFSAGRPTDLPHGVFGEHVAMCDGDAASSLPGLMAAMVHKARRAAQELLTLSARATPSPSAPWTGQLRLLPAGGGGPPPPAWDLGPLHRTGAHA